MTISDNKLFIYSFIIHQSRKLSIEILCIIFPFSIHFHSLFHCSVTGVTTTELVFTGHPGERPRPERRNTYTKPGGNFTDETTSKTEYVDHRTVHRAEIIRKTDNLTTGKGEFIVSVVFKIIDHNYIYNIFRLSILNMYNYILGYLACQTRLSNLRYHTATSAETDQTCRPGR